QPVRRRELLQARPRALPDGKTHRRDVPAERRLRPRPSARAARRPRCGLSHHCDRNSRMKLGFFTMPIHPVDKDWRQSLREDREAFLLADELGFSEAYVGEHVTDRAENITSCIAFIAWLAAATKQIKLGTGTINMPNTHP